MKSRVLLAQVHLILSEIFQFLCHIVTVLSVKHKIKALLFRVLIYEGLREFIWHDSLSSPGPIAVSKKNQPINQLVYVIRMRARRLFLFFNSFSPNMLEMKKLIRDYKINKSLSGLLVYRRIMPLAKRFSSKFHICPRKLFIFRTISQPRALSSDIPAARRGLFTK